MIRANGDASLFLINPAGIIFGENARLDLGGSFYGSTADSILFEDGEFSASDLENPPLLTINAPIGLSFRDNPGDIVNRANFGLTEQSFEQSGEVGSRITNITGLEVNPGQNLALIGGNITLIRSGLTAPGGNVTLGGLSQAGTVAISPDGIFSFRGNAAKANLSLENNALVSVIGNGGGSIDVDVSNLTLSGQSQLRAGIAEGAGDSNTVGLPPTRVENFNNEDVGNTAGSSGSIFIVTKALNITERGVISTRLYGVGNAGDININADTVLLNQGTLTSQVGFEGDKGRGNSGDININSNNFTATNSTFVITDNRGTGAGNAGDININATDSVEIRDTNTTRFISETEVGTVGNAGNINIVADNFSLENNVQLTTQVKGRGDTGSINLDINDSLVISGGANIQAQVESSGEGEGGNIIVNANTFELLEDSQLLASNQNIGDAGNIIIQVDDSVSIDNSKILSQIEENAVGNAGDIKITANSLNLENNAELITAIRERGRGNTGSIDIDIADSIVLSDRSQIQAQVRREGQGEAGNVEIDTNTLEVLDRSLIIADSRSSGNSGDIAIQADESILVVNRSIISTGTIEDAQGSSGNIKIISPQISLKDGAIISSSAEGSGDTGDIDIDAETISLDNFSLITASSRTENSLKSGDINIINADRVTLTNGSIINATTDSEFDGGRININARILELLSGGVLQTATENDGDAGDIVLNIDNGIIVLDGNNAPERPEEFDFGEPIIDSLQGKTGIFANVSEDTPSRGGDIFIDSGFIVAFPNGNSDIIANAQQGQGGNITINAQLLGISEGTFSSPSNDIDASSDNSDLDGNVVIKSLDRDSIAQPGELQSGVIEIEQTTAQVCQSNREVAAKNTFTIKGKGGVPAASESPLNSDNILFSNDEASTSLDHRPSQSTTPQVIETGRGKIQLARGIKVTESGDIVLTAYRTNNAGERIPERRNCG